MVEIILINLHAGIVYFSSMPAPNRTTERC